MRTLSSDDGGLERSVMFDDPVDEQSKLITVTEFDAEASRANKEAELSVD